MKPYLICNRIFAQNSVNSVGVGSNVNSINSVNSVSSLNSYLHLWWYFLLGISAWSSIVIFDFFRSSFHSEFRERQINITDFFYTFNELKILCNPKGIAAVNEIKIKLTELCSRALFLWYLLKEKDFFFFIWHWFRWGGFAQRQMWTRQGRIAQRTWADANINTNIAIGTTDPRVNFA